MSSIHAPKFYWKNCLLLIGLLLLTVGFGYINLGSFNLVLALAVSVAKMILVALFFMHIKGSNRLLQLAAMTGLIWLLIMLALTLADYASRGDVALH